MPQLSVIEGQGASMSTTEREKDSNGPSNSTVVASPPYDNAIAEEDRGRRKKPLSFYGSFMSIVIMILMVSLDSSELGVALTVSNPLVPTSPALQIGGCTCTRLVADDHFRQSANN